LERFERAQAGVFDAAVREISNGRKASHWMWFIFPQLKGLGRSETARYFGIDSLAEAKDFLGHPILGPRLLAAVEALQALDDSFTAEQVFGAVDAMKLRSSLTLFAAAGGGAKFEEALERWFGSADEATLQSLS
jgi:uncharacterized protein (DUF1810 family)